MRIIKQNYKDNAITVHIENLDDLWVLSKIIDEKTAVFGKTTRKIESDSTERSSKAIRKTVNLEIAVEKVEYEPTLSSLRVLGKITHGPDEIPLGDHHSFLLAPDTDITIKKKFHSYERQKIDQATKQAGTQLVFLFDREQVLFFTYSQMGFCFVAETQADSAKKQMESVVHKDIFSQIKEMLDAYIKKYKPKTIIACGSHFWKAQLEHTLAEKITFIDHTEITKSSVEKLLKNPQFQKVLQDDNFSQIQEAFDIFLKHLATDSLAAYGVAEVKKAAEMGAIKTLLVANKKVHDVEQLLDLADQQKAQIYLVEDEHPITKELLAMTGVACILRFAI